MKLKAYNFILTLAFAFLLANFLPWYSVMLAGFLSGAIVRLRKATTFFVPFLAITLFWFINAWLLSSANNFILAKKISVLLYLGGNPYLLMLVTGIVGGLAAGIAAIFGNQCRAAFSAEN
ncbi:hypothetical protein [Roseivirga misakiensis]|uniref:Uncharacterized protein n=1 Tax=Roseivirga misakiensis TaxID=1563681 RepID=A0A1E5T1I0_9BACT|nr:hypothetical protein [Roseivirga misakiensis]OEK05238.1 hypothetical protein BFP71_17705 [Roseivirga misakiensis]